jgi:tetratricopeptide (TPR) repeat protein
MDYRGNPSLPKEIKDRILTTFQQTLQSAREGNYQEAMLGCDFILRLDPDFQPAQQLTERLKKVAGKDAASAGPEVPPPPAEAPPAPAELAPQMQRHLKDRNFQALLDLAEDHRDAVVADAALRGLVETAQSRLEAEPLIQNLVSKARPMLENGQLQEVDALLEKGRALDPEHPALEELTALRQAMAAPPGESAGADTGPIDLDALGADSLGPSEEPALGSLEEDPLGALEEDPFSLGEEDGGLSLGAADEDDPFAAEAAGSDTLEPDPFGTDTFDDALGSAASSASAGTEDAFSFGDAPDASDPFALGDEDAGGADDPFALEEDDAGGASDPFAIGEDASEDDPFAVAEEDAGGPDAFSLEEESAPAPSAPDPFALEEDSPAEGTPAGTSAGGEDSDSRIGELLSEGQALFERDDYQGAIDAWSRIFLIDIDHREATQRIEKARSLKAEQERQVEEVFHEGLEQLKAGKLEEAQGSFRKVLELQPGHGAAQEYLQQLEAGEVPELTGIGMPPPGVRSDTSSVPTPEEIAGGLSLDEEGDDGELKEEILVPPDFSDLPGGAPVSGLSGDKPPSKDASGARRKFVLIGAGVLVVVALVGGYAWLNRDTWFPNSDAPAPTGQPLQMPKNPIEEARRLHAEGKTDQALRQLKLLPQDNAYHEEAQKLIAELEGTLDTGPVLPPEEAALRDELLAESVQYFAAGEMLRAQEVLIAAGEMAPLEGEDAGRMEQVQQRLAPLQQEIALVREGEWETALRDLWRLQVEDPNNRDVVRLLTDCYYNLGVQALQRGNVAQAEGRFGEVLQLAPEDIEAQRHFRFAQAYQQKSQDLLFRIYVKYLPFR